MAGQADPVDRGRETLLRALREGDVRFVVIGGAALQSHGQRYDTEDIDVAPDRAQQNLERLADVLNHLECSLEVDPAHPEKAVLLPPGYFPRVCSRRLSCGICVPLMASLI
jgi:putative NADH-flavin reductase